MSNTIKPLFKLLSVLFFMGISPGALLASEPSLPYFPLKKEAVITSTFLESRGTRYHAGIDFSTQNQEGWPVIAPEQGRIFRLRQSPWGYGKAIYFKGNSGAIYVYAHLSGFAQQAFDQVTTQLKKNNSLSADFRISKGLEFRRGDTLGFSGSTGIGDPHLHYETRSSESEVISPVHTDLNKKSGTMQFIDSLKPELKKMWVWAPGYQNRQSGDYKGSMPRQAFWLDSTNTAEDTIKIPAKFWGPKMHFGLALVDYASEPKENPMSISKLKVYSKNNRGSKELYFEKDYQKQNYGTMDEIKWDLIGSSGSEDWDWHWVRFIQEEKPIKNLNIQTPNSKPFPEILFLEIEDFKGQGLTKTLIRSEDVFEVKPKALWQSWGGQFLGDSLKHQAIDTRHGMFSYKNTFYQFDGVSLHYPWLDFLHTREQALEPPTGTYWPSQDAPVFYQNEPLGTPGRYHYCFVSPEDSKTGIFYQNSKNEWNSFSNLRRSGRWLCTSADEIRNVALLADSTAPQILDKGIGEFPLNGKPTKAYAFEIIEKGAGIYGSSRFDVKLNGTWVYYEWNSEENRLYIPLKYSNKGFLEIRVKDDFGNLGIFNKALSP